MAETFSDYLRKYRLKSRDPVTGNPLSQEALAENSRDDEIFLSRSAYQDLERGRTRPDANKYQIYLRIAKALYENGGVSSIEEIDLWLQAGDLRKMTQAEANFILGINASSAEPKPMARSAEAGWPASLPNDPYYVLEDREAELSRVNESLHRDPSGRLVVIDGMGGMGKTALALELARRQLDRGTYRGFIGDSAKLQIFDDGKILAARDAVLDLDAFLSSLARQLGKFEIASFERDQKVAALQRIFSQDPYLLIIDNIETTPNAEQIAYTVKNILGKGTGIITTRKKVSGVVQEPLSLDSLSSDDALIFLKHEAAAQQALAIQKAPKDQLAEIARLTGNQPLALKLVVSEARFVDLPIILELLETGQTDIYFYIYGHIWGQLDLVAQKILLYITETVNDSVSWEELQGFGFSKEATSLKNSLDRLVDYSMVTVKFSLGKYRYGIHQLTRQFLINGLPRIWKTAGRI
jgi:hypothetical protein